MEELLKNNLIIMTYLMLIGAILFEVMGTLLLPVSKGFTKPFPSIALLVLYGLSFYFLSIVSLNLFPLIVGWATAKHLTGLTIVCIIYSLTFFFNRVKMNKNLEKIIIFFY